MQKYTQLSNSECTTSKLPLCTSLLQLAQRRAECVSALTRQQAAGERLRSGEGSMLRPSGIPSE